MKNPLLSLWLSGANSAAGAARGFWTAEPRRQQKAVMNEAGRSLAPKKRAPSRPEDSSPVAAGVRSAQGQDPSESLHAGPVGRQEQASP